MNRKQQCYHVLNGHYPTQSTMLWKGIRITKADFERIKRGGR